jgi:predicted DNA-binding transcriptional regulator YafY
MLRIDTVLHQGRWPTAVSIAEELEVSERTIRRDIEYLRHQLHAPIEFDSHRNGYHYTNPKFRLNFLQLTEGELFSLFVAEQVLRQYRDTPYGAELENAFSKITAALTDPVVGDAARLAESLSFRTSAPPLSALSALETLTTSILQRRRLVIDYWTASRDSLNRRTVDPYHLASIDGQYYLVAYCHTRKVFRDFKADRIRAIETTSETFQRDPTFDVDAYLGSALTVLRGDGATEYHVRLRFTGTAVRYVRERLWHPTQKLKPTPDGALVLEFTVSHLGEAQRMVLSWSPECEALDPPELRAAVAEALAKAVRLHGQAPDSATPCSHRERASGEESGEDS